MYSGPKDMTLHLVFSIAGNVNGLNNVNRLRKTYRAGLIPHITSNLHITGKIALKKYAKTLNLLTLHNK
jgi:hypothetical protein